ncbi:MAG: NAD(P)H-hydrate repair Nnr-like enzyme with NAD(P)H-hydrate epimerase domain [Nonlabens sp.]|jgi:NAD(P)H-hydrate repair Nnr-like enzyme with NAD(P)H-hydrate epimerase domain/8-oxo-dGTP pyrophosphatase MutT (NUDIX family)
MTRINLADAFRISLAQSLAVVPPSELDTPDDGRVAAVLVLFTDDPIEGLQIVLTRRRKDLRSHPGQLSFPGGRVDDEDDDVIHTAMREASEEMGLRAESVSIVGRGRVFYLPPSRFWVAPVVAWWDAPHHLVASPDEVDEVLRVPVSRLMDQDRWRGVPLSAGGSTWAWQLDEDLLWGATAIVTALLLQEALGDWTEGIDPASLGPDKQCRPWEDAPAWTPKTRLSAVPGRAVADVPTVDRAGVSAVLAALGPARMPGVADAAARAVVDVVTELVGPPADHAATVLVGPAGTGGVGLRIAALLHDAGADVTVRLSDARDDVTLPAHLVVPPPPPGARVQVDRRMGFTASEVPEMDRPAGDVIIDALLGPGAEPPLRGGAAVLAAWAARYDLPVVSVALPSGVAADTGLIGPSLHADVTVALGLPTAGLLEAIVAPYAGEVVIADVGITAEDWASSGLVGAPADLFADGPIVRLDRGPVPSDAGTPDQGPPF